MNYLQTPLRQYLPTVSQVHKLRPNSCKKTKHETMLPNTATEEQALYVFGYGSLIWNPGFEYEQTHKGYAVGWARRMYQGNTYHRGDDKLPGRVATIIEDQTASTSGIVFRVSGLDAIKSAVNHLKEREVGNGYKFCIVKVVVEIDDHLETIDTLTCVATLDNEFYLGPDDTIRMAEEIGRARGRAGPNSDYVLKLAEQIRKLFPEDQDTHLFELEHHVRLAISARA